MDGEVRERTQAEKVKAIVAQQLGIAGTVDGAQRLVTDLKSDSLDNFELVMALEDEFGVDISDEDAGKLATVQDCIDLVERLTA